MSPREVEAIKFVDIVLKGTGIDEKQ